MKQQYIIDGYNLLHKFWDLKSRMDQDLEDARERLMIRLSGYKQRKNAEFVVVFDGNQPHPPREKRRMGLLVYFSQKGETADSVIKKLVDRSAKSKDVIVVSSDREVAGYAKLSGKKAIGATEFIQQMSTGPSVDIENKADTQLTPSEIEAWMRLFANGQNE